jgi:hypothetical protein
MIVVFSDPQSVAVVVDVAVAVIVELMVMVEMLIGEPAWMRTVPLPVEQQLRAAWSWPQQKEV